MMTTLLQAWRLLAMTLSSAVVATMLLGLGACGDGETSATALDGTGYELVGWSLSSIDPNEFTITASFADGKISGKSAVNSYGGSYTTGPGAAFSTGELASTMMAGPEADMRAESTYIELLRAAASFEQTGDKLTLYDADGNESLVFEPVAAE